MTGKPFLPRLNVVCAKLSSIACLFLAVSFLRADQIQMHNGDQYAGRVVTVTTNAVIFQSEVLGTISVPREKVALISLGTATTNQVARLPIAPAKPAVASVPATPAPKTDLAASLRQLKSDPTALKQVEDQYLANATPEARAKFNEMLSGLMSGSLTVTDIRSEAQSDADKLRKAKTELGEEAGDALDAYLAILDNFVRDTAAPKAATPRATTKPKIAPTAPADE